MVGQASLAGGRDIDGVDSLGDELLAAGRVEALNKDGVSFQHENQVEGGLDPEDKFFLRDDVEGAEFQSRQVVLVVEGS